MNYYQHSIDVIVKNQYGSGAYIASPNFPEYHYCWLRDGSFIAYSMDLAGQHESALSFFRWVDRVIDKYAHKVTELEEQLKMSPGVEGKSFLHTRYSLDGNEEATDSTWGNFQIDGYGTWLWALAEHIELTGNKDLLNEFSHSIETTLRYLLASWHLPNYDCWEEHPDYLHPYSLAAVCGGLQAIEPMLTSSQQILVHAGVAEIKAFLTRYGIFEDKFVKHIWPADVGQTPRPLTTIGVDASLLGLALPYAVFPLDHPVLKNTVAAIERELHRPQGGVYRYKGDVYYGGGEWLLLSAWLGWYYARTGRRTEAEELLRWLEASADENGDMPEQVHDHLLAPKHYSAWVNKWGPIATPLLWSHAMYIILYTALQWE